MSELLIIQPKSKINKHVESDNLQVVSFLASRPQNTKDTYIRILREFFEFTGKLIHEIKGSDIELYLKVYLEALSLSTKSLHKNCLSSFFNFLLKDGYIDKSPASNLPRIKVDKTGFQDRLLELDEIKKMVEVASKDRDKVLVEFLFQTGLRVSEALSLKLGDFKKLPGKEIYRFAVNGKGNKTRLGVVSENLYKKLISISLRPDKKSSYLFEVKRSGKITSLTRKRLSDILRDLGQKAGIYKSVSAHSLRHAYATHHLRSGTPIHVVKQNLGHSSIETTSRYLHVGLENHTILELV